MWNEHLARQKSTYRHNAQIGKYCTILTSEKKIWFWPSTHFIDEASFVKIVSNSWQAEVIARSMSYQTPWTDKNLARNHSATKLVFESTVTTIHSTYTVKKRTVLSFLGIMKDGDAHSDAGCLSNTPSWHSLSTSFLMVSLWTFGTGKARPW